MASMRFVRTISLKWVFIVHTWIAIALYPHLFSSRLNRCVFVKWSSVTIFIEINATWWWLCLLCSLCVCIRHYCCSSMSQANVSVDYRNLIGTYGGQPQPSSLVMLEDVNASCPPGPTCLHTCFWNMLKIKFSIISWIIATWSMYWNAIKVKWTRMREWAERKNEKTKKPNILNHMYVYRCNIATTGVSYNNFLFHFHISKVLLLLLLLCWHWDAAPCQAKPSGWFLARATCKNSRFNHSIYDCIFIHYLYIRVIYMFLFIITSYPVVCASHMNYLFAHVWLDVDIITSYFNRIEIKNHFIIFLIRFMTILTTQHNITQLIISYHITIVVSSSSLFNIYLSCEYARADFVLISCFFNLIFS